MDNDIEKAKKLKVAYDDRFKQVTDEANLIATAVSDSRLSTIRTMIESGLSTVIIIKAGFTTEEINVMKERQS